MHALTRITSSMSFSKRRILLNAFFKLQFSYSPLHERCLCAIYNDKQSTFQELLDKEKSVLIHSSNLQTLAIEIRVTRGIASDIFANILNKRKNMVYHLRHFSNFTMFLVNSVYNGTETLSFLGAKI